MLAAIYNKRTQDRNLNMFSKKKFRRRWKRLCLIPASPRAKSLFGTAAGLIIRSGWSGTCLGGVRATFIVSLLLWNTTDERPEDQFIKPTTGTP